MVNGALLSILVTAFSTTSLGLGFLLDSLGGQGSRSLRDTCYPDLGCFSNRAPFHTSERPLPPPANLSLIDTTFLLYTRDTWGNVSQHVESLAVTQPATVTHFSPARATKVIVHGFLHSAHRPWVNVMVGQILTHHDVNVIAVDWYKGAQLPYEQAASNARVVGSQIAQLLVFLHDRYGNHNSDVHVIGHSLGAHVAGYAGERSPGLGRISGLDASAPFFQDTAPQLRLDPSDAMFVDVIHTDTSSLAELGMGIGHPLGHVDVYPNGGAKQPGCESGALGTLAHTVWNAATVGLFSAEGALACSHQRAIDLFTESINTPCPFTAFPCPSHDDFAQGRCLRCHGNGCTRLGYHGDTMPGRGAFYLNTEAQSPFCGYNYEVNVTAETAADGILTVTLIGDKGRSLPQPLTQSNEIINQGRTTSHMMTTSVDVGNVTSLAVHYDKSSTLVLHLIFDDIWTVRDISLWDADSQRRVTFCASGHRIPDDAMSVFHHATGSC